MSSALSTVRFEDGDPVNVVVKQYGDMYTMIRFGGKRSDLELQFGSLGSALLFLENVTDVVDAAARDEDLSATQEVKVG